ncbi:MAG: MBL fold metallo-hydrolase, partial [Oscillospiraceae bacterium]
MQLTFLGATHEVTGSCFYLTACGKKLLIDCGMEQGPDEFENQEIPVGANEIDEVLLTHAHIDHSGRIPLLVKHGFSGRIHATAPTADLCNIMLRDSAHIQEFEAEWRNRKAQRSGHEAYVPLYTMDDALGAIALLSPHPYKEKIALCEGIELRFIDVGHLLGSASIELWVTENGVTQKLVFSGDIGNTHQPLLRDPEAIAEADFVVMESTYGDRSHGPKPDYVRELAAIIQRTFDRGGNLVIPSFAVGRTQEMLYFLRQIKADGLVTGHGEFPVYVDSPLAVEATNIFRENGREVYDEDAMALLRQGINPLRFEGLSLSITSEESKAINFDSQPKVILSASGMCEAGRIKHHLKHNLWRKESTVLFVGYQAVGTLGRAVLGGAEEVKLFGETVEVKAEIRQLANISGHADAEGLMRWAAALQAKPARVFVVHGDDGPA